MKLYIAAFLFAMLLTFGCVEYMMGGPAPAGWNNYVSSAFAFDGSGFIRQPSSPVVLSANATNPADLSHVVNITCTNASEHTIEESIILFRANVQYKMNSTSGAQTIRFADNGSAISGTNWSITTASSTCNYTQVHNVTAAVINVTTNITHNQTFTNSNSTLEVQIVSDPSITTINTTDDSYWDTLTHWNGSDMFYINSSGAYFTNGSQHTYNTTVDTTNASADADADGFMLQYLNSDWVNSSVKNATIVIEYAPNVSYAETETTSNSTTDENADGFMFHYLNAEWINSTGYNATLVVEYESNATIETNVSLNGEVLGTFDNTSPDSFSINQTALLNDTNISFTSNGSGTNITRTNLTIYYLADSNVQTNVSINGNLLGTLDNVSSDSFSINQTILLDTTNISFTSNSTGTNISRSNMTVYVLFTNYSNTTGCNNSVLSPDTILATFNATNFTRTGRERTLAAENFTINCTKIRRIEMNTSAHGPIYLYEAGTTTAHAKLSPGDTDFYTPMQTNGERFFAFLPGEVWNSSCVDVRRTDNRALVFFNTAANLSIYNFSLKYQVSSDCSSWINGADTLSNLTNGSNVTTLTDSAALPFMRLVMDTALNTEIEQANIRIVAD